MCPVEKAPWGPLQVPLVGERHVCGHGGEAPLAGAAGMTGAALALAEDLPGGRRQAHVELLAHQTMGDTVEVASHFEVIIEMDAGLAPLGILVGLGGKGVSAGGSASRNRECREPGSFLNGR